jgi:hypothetical protein
MNKMSIAFYRVKYTSKKSIYEMGIYNLETSPPKNTVQMLALDLLYSALDLLASMSLAGRGGPW